MRLYLMRHASVDERYVGCYNGHIDINLSPQGTMEAAEAAAGLKGVEFDAVYCSDLVRCRQTLEPFGFRDVLFDERLREKSWGRAEGMRYDEICEKFGIVYDGFESFAAQVGGEGLEDFSTRVYGFFDELQHANAKNVLIVTHGGVIKTLLARINKLTLEEAFAIDVPYASITIIEDFI